MVLETSFKFCQLCTCIISPLSYRLDPDQKGQHALSEWFLGILFAVYIIRDAKICFTHMGTKMYKNVCFDFITHVL